MGYSLHMYAIKMPENIGSLFNNWKWWHHACISLSFKSNKDIRVKLNIQVGFFKKNTNERSIAVC